MAARTRRRMRGGRTSAAVALVVAATAAWSSGSGQETAPPVQVPSCFATVIDEIGEPVGAVIAGRDPGRQNYSAGDPLYLRVRREITPGEEYLVYRDEGEVHREDGRRLGHLIQLVGRVRVLERHADRAVARIVDSCGELEPGDLLHSILPHAPSAGASSRAYDPDRFVERGADDATVVFGSGESLPQRRGDRVRRSGLTPRRSYSVGDVVTIDRGSAQGWGQDTAVLFYTDDPRRSFGVASEHGEPVALGIGVVIWVSADSAAVLVTAADRAIGLGDRAQRLR